MTSETSRTIRVMEDDNILLIWHSVSGLQLWLGAVVQSRKEKKRKEKKRKEKKRKEKKSRRTVDSDGK